MKTSLLVSTYNRPKALRVCFESIRKQTKLPDEILIADDGSTEETLQLIKEISEKFPVPIKHIWQEDKGFRRTKILNKALSHTEADFILQIDGDVFLHPNYIEDFISVAREGFCILGSRVCLSKKRSKEIEDSGKIPTIYPWSRGIIQKPFRAIYSKIGRLISKSQLFINKKNKSQGFGCSLGYWRKDFLLVNGYDEDFEGWGSEDRDFLLRLGRSGIFNHKVFFIGIVYHLWHKEEDRSNQLKNSKLCYSKKDIFCHNGVSQYL